MAADKPAETRGSSASNASQGARANQIESRELETTGHVPAWIGRTAADPFANDELAAELMALDLADQLEADRAEVRKNGRPDRGPVAGPRPPAKGTRKHCSTHDERRDDCYRCQTEGCF